MPDLATRFALREDPYGWYIEDTADGSRLPYDHGLGGAYFTFRPTVEQVLDKLNAVAAGS